MNRSLPIDDLMVMLRANAESRLIGERIAATWSRKRTAARERAIPLSNRVPGWLIVDRDDQGLRTFAVNGDSADVVRRIFAETVRVFGRWAIAKGLNRDGKLSFLSQTSWQPLSVNKIVRARTSFGEYQLHKRDGDGRLVPDGQAIKGYNPTVIDEALWIRANAAVNVRRTNSAGRPQTEVANLLRELAHSTCGKRMLFINKGPAPKGGRYYMCSEAARDGGWGNKRLRKVQDVERNVLHRVNPGRIAAAFEPAQKENGTTAAEYDLVIGDLEAMRVAALNASLRHAGTLMGLEYEGRVESLVEEIAQKRVLRAAAAVEENSRPNLTNVKSAVGTIAELSAKLETADHVERVALRTAIVQQL